MENKTTHLLWPKSISFGSERQLHISLKWHHAKRIPKLCAPVSPYLYPFVIKPIIALLSAWTEFPSRFVAVFACSNQGFKVSVMQSFLWPLSFLKMPVYGKTIKSFCFSFWFYLLCPQHLCNMPSIEFKRRLTWVTFEWNHQLPFVVLYLYGGSQGNV